VAFETSLDDTRTKVEVETVPRSLDDDKKALEAVTHHVSSILSLGDSGPLDE
jgi:hypothetical protein